MPFFAPSVIPQAGQIPFWDGNGTGYQETPQESWSPWDTVYLSYQALPGLSRVVIRKPPKIRLQHRSPSGTDGASPIMLGYEPAAIVIEVAVWTPAQLQALIDFPVSARSSDPSEPAIAVKLLETPKLSKANSKGLLVNLPVIPVSHPAFIMSGISSMYIYSILPFEDSHTRGVKSMKIEGYEFFPIAKASAAGKPKPVAAQPTAGVGNVKLPSSGGTDP